MDKLQMAVQKGKVLDQTNKLLVKSYERWTACRVSGLNGWGIHPDWEVQVQALPWATVFSPKLL